MTTITFVRHIPIGDFAYDELTLTHEYTEDDPLTLEQRTGVIHDSLQFRLPYTAPPLTPAAHAPAPYATPTPAAAFDLVTAESMPSPCGDSKGKPLCMCTDADLDFIANRFKKGGHVKDAAAFVLAARRAGQTTQR